MGTDLFSLGTDSVPRENRSVPIKIVPIKIYSGQATGSLLVNANRRMTSAYPEYR